MNCPWSKPKGAYHCEKFGINCNHDCDNCEQLKEWEAQQAKYKQEPCEIEGFFKPGFAARKVINPVAFPVPYTFCLTYMESGRRRAFLVEKQMAITLDMVARLMKDEKIDGLREITPETGIPQIFLDMDK